MAVELERTYGSFNTQPPEGGCVTPILLTCGTASFNTQPPEGGCFVAIVYLLGVLKVSTHSRPKAAAFGCCKPTIGEDCFNTQPPEGGCFSDWLSTP